MDIIRNLAGALQYFDPHGRGHDYWVQDRNAVAFFGGKLGEELGLGEFDIGQFHALMSGRHPLTGERLTPGLKENKRPGYEVTVDGPKDLGVLLALGLDDRIVPEVLIPAGNDAMALLERDAHTRVRAGGQDTDRHTGSIAYAGVLHLTARQEGDKIDVHPHIHFLVANATRDYQEGRIKALQLQPFAGNGQKEARPYYSAFLNARLAEYMQRLGYELAPDGKGSFHVVGVPDRVRKEFSQRTARIEKEAARLEERKQQLLGDPTAKLSPEAKAKLGMTTRKPKEEGQSWEALLEHWNGRVTPEEKRAVLDTVARSLTSPHRPAIDNLAALEWAIDHLSERKSVFSERELVTAAIKHGIGTATVAGIHSELARHRGLIRREENGRTLVSTHDIRKEEEAIVRFALQGRGRHRALGNRGAKVPETLKSGENKPPSASQANAMRHLWHSPDPIIVWDGKAGVGKTETLLAALAQVNVPWGAFATQSSASRGALRDSGIPGAETITTLLGNREMQERLRGGLIVIDEISQTGSKEFRQVCELAHRIGARILAIGDPRQHKSVPRGDLFALFDKAGLPRARISDIKRQKGEYLEVAQMLSRGEMADAVARLDKMGWVKETGVADDYLAALRAGETALVVVPTHAEGDRVAAEIRGRLKTEGRVVKRGGKAEEVGVLHGEEREFPRLVPLHLTRAERAACLYDEGTVLQFVKQAPGRKPGERLMAGKADPKELPTIASAVAAYRPAAIRLRPGDTIRTTANVKDCHGNRIDNGTFLTVTGVKGGKLRVQTPSGLARQLPADVGHIQYGYVSTSQAGQGKTVDRAFLWVPRATFGAVKMDTAYTSGTRGRKSLTLYTDDRQGLLQAIQREDTRLLASDLVRQPREGLRRRAKRFAAFLRHNAAYAQARGPGRPHTAHRETRGNER